MSDNGAGFLEVGTNDTHQVVVNLPRDMTGHIVFSPQEARELAETLTAKARAADAARFMAAEEQRIASLPAVDRSKMCTTNGKPVEEVRASQTNETGQHEGYIVLCEEERAKGFLRPLRRSYRHVGRSICAKTLLPPNGNVGRWTVRVCDLPHGHDGECDGPTRDLEAADRWEPSLGRLQCDHVDGPGALRDVRPRPEVLRLDVLCRLQPAHPRRRVRVERGRRASGELTL